MAVDRLPSGSFRARLMIDGRRYTATWPTEADARLWEVETRAAVAERRGAGSVTFGVYAEGWLAGFVDDAPDRERFESALEHELLPALGQLPLVEVLESDRAELHGRLPDIGRDGDDGATRECLHLILEDAAGDLRNGVVDVCAPARKDQSGCRAAGSGARWGQPAGRSRSRAAVPSK